MSGDSYRKNEVMMMDKFFAARRVYFPVLILLISLIGPSGAFSQNDAVYSGIKDATWQKLFRIDYEILEDYDEYGDLTVPVFSEDVKQLSGKKITLTGYIFPFENALNSSHLMFTALPVNACFFCGVGGPESVVEIFMNDQIEYVQGKISITGVLELNDSNPEQMMYILNSGELVKE
jgi:hypothetical protein